MKRVVATGKTVEEAITSALVRLGVTRAEATVRVISEPVKGILGFIGGKDAEVEVTVNPSPPEAAKAFLTDLLSQMGIEAVVHLRSNETAEEGTAVLNIVCDEADLSTVIGRHGAVLDALQYLVNVSANKDKEHYVKFYLDAGDYRERRRKGLERMAEQAANRAVRTRRPVTMESMPAADRKVIHTYLQSRVDVSTSSEGVDPHRKVVVSPVGRSRPGSRGERTSGRFERNLQ
ncbi:protein jag [Alicyclobacillus cycloheptanicus]|uniref:RNA-binding protein KhpB n=1 Tax=Alicyclobacillus cycloheptanicus TaxID=1457 RepID=A0ABT9XKY3_9BACL|nr:RNA-binding cell elongation regulator Jag/EloR [Alicyclobacillus cycloheptanicus]MDQ0190948.1 spoIIIJ-associated protein [Alicyclobacillus cycloheptanicus]WDM02396.1 protein jag [Alicyclobacillus cycloheptanicus]